MKKGMSGIWYLAIALALIIVILAFALLKNFPVQKSPYENINCEKINYNGEPENKINILFFANNVGKEELLKYADSFLKIKPYSDFPEKFNFYYLDYAPKCKIKDSALLCYSKDLIKASSLCPNDYIAVVSSERFEVRSSAYMNVISLNSKAPMNVLAHEFAHVFANLADEYVPASIPRNSKNCASDCKIFENAGCFNGCSKSELFRSVESSIMRTLRSASYGGFNENLISKKMEKY